MTRALLVTAMATGLTLLAPAAAGADYTVVSGEFAEHMRSSASDDKLVIDHSGGVLRHNRFAAGDPGFAGAADFNTDVAGVQTLSNASGTSLEISAPGGTVTLGTPAAPAGTLLAKLAVSEIGLDPLLGLHLTVDDSGADAARAASLHASSLVLAPGSSIAFHVLGATTVKGGQGSDVLSVKGIHARTNVLAGPGNDAIVFAAGAGLGSGAVDGGTGANRLDYSAYASSIVTDLGAGVSTGTGKVTSTRHVIGSAGPDVLIGGSNANHLEGGPGDDGLVGRGGKDVLDGGAGTRDRIDYSQRAGRVVVTLDQKANDGADTDGDGVSEESDHDLGVEQAMGGAGDDHLRGSAQANLLMGYDGDDKLEGLAGDDDLVGGLDADVLDGGEGTGDRIRYDRRATPVAVRLDGAANDGADPDENGSSAASEEGDTDVAIEHVVGGDHGDHLVGNDLVNQLTGGPGDDNLDGGTGGDVLDGGDGAGDTVDYSLRTGPVRVKLGSGGLHGAVGEGDREFGVENVIGGYASDQLAATGQVANVLTGGYGDDDLDGGPGPDVLDGGAGYHDVMNYSARPSTDRVAVRLDGAPGDGSDPDADGFSSADEERDTDKSIEAVRGGSGGDHLTGRNLQNDYLYGSGGADTLTGLSGFDQLSGGSGGDHLSGTGGQDILWGGTGNDTLNGGEGDDRTYGEAGHDALDGDAGADYMLGGDGDDVLDGGTASDRLYGGAGVDEITYASRSASQPVSVRLDGRANDGQSGELDQDLEIEDARGGAGADFLYAMVPGNTVVNRLYGGPGNDLLRTTDGTSTFDQLHCESGTDRYAKDSNDLRWDCETVQPFP